METKSEEKLSVIELLKRAAKLLLSNINLALFLFLCSLPLFCFLIFFKLSLQTTVSLAFQYLYNLLSSAEDLTLSEDEHKFIPWLIHTSMLYIFPYTILDLLTTTIIVAASSIVYTSKEEPSELLYLVRRSLRMCQNRVKGCLITSIYVLFLSTSVFLGFFIDLAIYVFIASLTSEQQRLFNDQAVLPFYVVLFHVVVALIHGTVFIVLTAKFSKWSVGWNICMVVSVLEEDEDIYGSNALTLSAWYIRRQEKRHLWMMLMFLVGALVTRMPCLYFKCSESLSGNGVLYTGLYVGLICIGNVLKWVSCVVVTMIVKLGIWRREVMLRLDKKRKAFVT